MARVPSNPAAAPKRTAAKVAAERFAGGCACDAVRYRLLEPPLFVHACHCTRCQRESGSAFTVNAIVLARTLELRQGEPEHVAVPTDSGRQQWIARCPSCRVGLWSHYGSAQGLVRYLRVGTLDEPAAAPPLAHIFVRSKLPWVVLDGGVPTFTSHYDARKVWPADSLVRYEAVRGPG
jgi:hypothetical protein